MSSERNKRNVSVGIFITIGLIFFVVGVLAIGNINKTFTKSFLISTVFDDVNGLKLGNNIWYSGVKIGTVKDISFSGTSQVKVVMEIEEKSRPYIKKDAQVKLGSDGFIGNKVIVIFGGTEKSAPVDDGDALVSVRLISTEDMMTTLQKNNTNVLEITTTFNEILDKMGNGEGTLGKLLTDDLVYNDLHQSLVALQSAIQNVDQLTADIRSVTDKLDDDGNVVNALLTDTVLYPSLINSVTHLEELTASAKTMVESMVAITGKLETNTESAAGVVLNDPEVASQLKETIVNLQEASKKLNENMEALQHSFLLKGYFKDKE